MNFDLKKHIDKVYNNTIFHISEFAIENEGIAYSACQFKLNEFNIICRKAKKTPKKVGQFVTFWKRNNLGVTEPFNEKEPIDFYVIIVNHENRLGQFIIPKSILINKGILSTEKKDGKRGFRVYPPWDKATNKQAIKTQTWQLNYYINIEPKINLEHLKALYSNKL